MLSPIGKKVEQNVLSVYQKQNPSTYLIENNEELFDKIETVSAQLYTNSLKILPKVFDGAKLLEFGTGTGENSLCFLKWNANCTFVEINPKAIKRASFLCNKYFPDSNFKFVESSLFDFETTQKFDITLSKGVIHHTDDKEKAFAKQVSYLKPGGINILGIGSTAGGFQRNLQRYIIYRFAGRDESKIEQIANDLFKEHLDRSEKFGGRTRKAIIYDSYVNPKIDGVSMAELLNWYKKYNLQLFSCSPPVLPSFAADSISGKTDWRNFPELLSLREQIWATKKNTDQELAEILEEEVKEQTYSFRKLTNAVNDVQAENLNPSEISELVESVLKQYSQKQAKDAQKIREFKGWLQEIMDLLKALDSTDYKKVSSIINNSQRLFRGRSGVGLNYFVAIKE